jgi:hypothetical protein
MKNRMLSRLSVLTFTTLTSTALAQDHGHLNVGAIGTNQNDQLIFDNGDVFDTATNYVKTLVRATSGTYSGYYQGNITLTALAATPTYLGPVPNAPALGSWIFAQLVSVDGPAGGAFAVWDTGATSPTISLVSGTTGTNTFRLSESDGSPGTDPYGHIHGRRFTATLPGIYTVGLRAFDFSTNGVNGGPIHSPSPVLRLYFQAGVNIKHLEPDVDHTHVEFSAPIGQSWVVEAADSLATNTTWTTISAPIVGDDYFHEITDDQTVAGNRFYRMRGF